MVTVHEADSTGGWADVLERVCFPLVVEQVRPGPFHAAVTWVDLGRARLYRVRSGPLAYRRDRAQIRAASGHHFVLPIPLRSSIVRDQQGSEVVIGPGQGSLGDSATPYRYVQLGGGEVLSLRLEASALLARVPARATRGGVALDLRSGSGRLITDLLGGVWALGDADDSVRARVGGVVLDLVALALEDARPALGETAVREAMHARVLRYVEQHLGDPDLDPRSIAAELGISLRYLHGLFVAHDTTLMRHVRARRLERAYEDLDAATPASRSVTAVAHRWGFRDAAHFSRSFRTRFGRSPREVLGGRSPSRPR